MTETKRATILDEIIAHKKKEVSAAQARVPLAELERQIAGLPPPVDFAAALEGDEHIAVIAEIKRASPSAGVLRAQFDPVAIAEAYQANGAAALSILTDQKFFHGSLSHLQQVRPRCRLPILRKDFIISPYQIAEARAAGADAVLLIVAALSRSQFAELAAAARRYALAMLVEIHHERELETALAQEVTTIGINNRDLATFEVSLQTTLRLAPLIPDRCLTVSESGIRRREDIEELSTGGIDAVLVGSHLMRETEPGAALKKLTGVERS